MKLYLYRKIRNATYTIGKLYEGVQFLCNTLEDPVRKLIDLNDDGDFNDSDEGKIYGETAIPAGMYQIKIQHSPKFGKDMPYLHNVPGFTGIMIHAGNEVKHTAGCLLVGEHQTNGHLINSAAWAGVIREKIMKAIEADEEVWIEIIEE